jgi:hypothetical protein
VRRVDARARVGAGVALRGIRGAAVRRRAAARAVVPPTRRERHASEDRKREESRRASEKSRSTHRGSFGGRDRPQWKIQPQAYHAFSGWAYLARRPSTRS